MEWNGIFRKKVEDSNCIRQLVLTPYPSLYIWLLQLTCTYVMPHTLIVYVSQLYWNVLMLKLCIHVNNYLWWTSKKIWSWRCCQNFVWLTWILRGCVIIIMLMYSCHCLDKLPSVNKVNHDMQAQSSCCAQNYAGNAHLATGSNQFDLIIPLALLELWVK